jgi:hypothetical protein
MQTATGLILLSALLIGCSGIVAPSSAPPDAVASTTPPLPTNRPASPSPDPLQAQALEFRRLREIEGQFSGGGWQEAVDDWGGAKHQLMLVFETQLTNGDYDAQAIADLLGPPDALARPGDRLHSQIDSLPEWIFKSDQTEFLIYFWRAEHDFLFFATQQGEVIDAGWWYAGE